MSFQNENQDLLEGTPVRDVKHMKKADVLFRLMIGLLVAASFVAGTHYPTQASASMLRSDGPSCLGGGNVCNCVTNDVIHHCGGFDAVKCLWGDKTFSDCYPQNAKKECKDSIDQHSILRCA